MRRVSVCFWTYVLLANGTTLFAQSDAVVKIYARGATRNGVGSGFFVNSDGLLVTAYHVVQGARQLQVAHEELGMFSDVSVEYISPRFDLAVLRVQNAINDLPYLPVDNTSDFRGQLSTSGFPKSGPLQRFFLRATRDSFVNSLRIEYPDGTQVYTDPAQGFDVMPLDVTIYSGMSGGPVIGANGVVGVLSGSYNEGGSIAWAVPTSYLVDENNSIRADGMTAVGHLPSLVSWPPLTMSEYWRSMLAPVRINQRIGAYFDQYTSDVEDLAQSYLALSQSAQRTYLQVLAYRAALETVISDPVLQNDVQASNDLLGPVEEVALGSLRGFFSLSSDMYDSTQRIRVTFGNIVPYVVDESGLSDEEGRALVEEFRALRAEYQGFTGTYGLDSYLGLDSQAAAQSLPRLRVALERAGQRPGAVARAYLEFTDAWLPVLQQYHSPNAQIFYNRDVSKFRRTGELLQSVVYR